MYLSQHGGNELVLGGNWTGFFRNTVLAHYHDVPDITYIIVFRGVRMSLGHDKANKLGDVCVDGAVLDGLVIEETSWARSTAAVTQLRRFLVLSERLGLIQRVPVVDSTSPVSATFSETLLAHFMYEGSGVTHKVMQLYEGSSCATFGSCDSARQVGRSVRCVVCM